MITGDDPILTLIVFIPTVLLILAGELGERSMLAGLPRTWRIAAYVSIGEALVVIIAIMGVVIAALIKTRYPWS